MAHSIPKIVVRPAAPRAKSFPLGATVVFVTTENETVYGTYQGRVSRKNYGTDYLVLVNGRSERLFYNSLPGRSLTVQK